MTRRAAAAAATSLMLAARVAGAEILDVSHRPEGFDPRSGKSVAVRFRLSEPAGVTLSIFDARDLVIRTVASSGSLSTGDHQIEWDGRDERGELVPPEAYTYALEARGANGKVWQWDVAAFGGSPVDVTDLVWDAAAGEVRYRLPNPARIRIRLGLENGGPLLRTLIDWVPRMRGNHAEPWDGRDASGVLALAHHPTLVLDGRAFELPQNTIFVNPPAAESRFIANLPRDAKRRAQPPAPAHRMFDYALQAAEQRGDFPITLSLPKDLRRTADGVPIVHEAVPVRLEASGSALARASDERSETVFFVDGDFVFERETGFLPMTWTWDPKGHAPGLHHLTANVRGYEGHFGLGTTLVWVEATASPAKP